MQIKKNYHFGLIITTASLAVSLITFTTQNSKENLCADDLPVSELYFAPASVTNAPHTYTDSPTEEPWYYTTHSFRNTSDPDNKYYDFCQRDSTYNRMNVTSTWQSYRGEGVRVAVIDTGCYSSHEDFNGTNFTLGKNMVSGATGPAAFNDTNGHGSSSAATIAAAINSVGGSGIAPNVELVILKCVDSTGSFSNSAILNALQYCIDNDVDIINMSIQGYSSSFNTTYTEDFGEITVNTTSIGIMSSTYLQSKINECYNAGITLVAAAGNYNTSKESYPAANNHVIAVASTGMKYENRFKKAGFSNYGSWIDISAPGYITTPTLTSTSSYSITYGTSFSAPLVTGAIALYKSKYPNSTPDQIEKALKVSATELDWDGGAGAINVDAFLALDPETKFVESLTLPELSKSIEVGKTYQISPTLLPVGCNQNVIYESSDDSIASVSSTGLVTAKKEGQVYIQATSAENHFIYDMMEINVEPSSETPKTIAVTLSNGVRTGDPAYITWTVNNVATIKQEKNTGSNDVGNYISAPRWYTDHLITFTPESGVTIVGLSITCNSNTYATVLKNSSWSTGSATSSDVLVTWTGSSSDAFNVVMDAQARISAISISYTTGSVVPKTLSSIAVTTSSHRTFTVGSNFVKETITATYSDSSEADVTNSAIFTGYNMDQSGTQTVNVSYTENDVNKQTSYQISVNAAPAPTNYTVSFNSNGGSGIMSNQTTSGSSYVVPKCDFTRQDYKFSKWALNSASGTKYSVGDTINGIATNITLYAIWIKEGGGSDIPEHYYDSITDSMSGTTLLTKLRELNLEKRTSTVGYSAMGTDPSGMFKYTDYDPNSTISYDSKGQPYGSKILSFYSGISTTSWNREHVWPNSRGGGSGGSAGSPYPDADIFMPRPTITEENSNRGNSKYVEGIVSTTAGWDPVTAFKDTIGVYQSIRGECARIIFYCMTVNSKLVLDDTSTGGTLGVTMGKLSDLLRWNLANPVNPRELTRQSGGMYLQGNRNAFVDDPGYACRIWGNYNSETQKICGQSVKKLSNLSYTGTPTKTSYNNGENFDPSGLTVTAKYEDGTTENVTSDVTWSPSPLTTGTTSVTGSFTSGGVTKSIVVNGISVSQQETSSITITRDSCSTNSQYQWSNWSQDDISGQLFYFGPTKDKIQLNGSKSGKAIFSSVTNGKYIDSITIKSSSGTPSFTIYGSNTAYTTSSTTSGTSMGSKNSSTTGVTWSFGSNNLKYFSIVLDGSSAAYVSEIKVTYKSSSTPKVNSIEIPNTLTIDKYTEPTKTIVPIIDADEGAQYTVSWTSSDTEVATVVSSGNNGIVTPLKVGTTTITVTAGDKSDTCTLTVTDSTPKVNSITLNKNSAELDLNGTKTVVLTPTVNADIGADTTVTWTSNNPSVAIVSKSTGTKNESITITAKGVGNATITASCGGKTATCTINVIDSTPVSVSGVTLNKNSTSISIGSSETLIATVLPENATNKNVSWSSSNSNVSVNSDGKITANAVGNAVITVTTQDGGYTATCNITVTLAPVIEYRLEAQESVPYANGTNKQDNIEVKLYQYTNGVKDKLITTGTCSVDTSSLGYKELSLTYNTVKYTTQIKVTNVGASDNVGINDTSIKTDKLNIHHTSAEPGKTDYASWGNVKDLSGAVYAGQSAGGNYSIQLRSKNSNSGIVQTSSGGNVSKVSVEFESHTSSGRILEVYGKDTAYTQATDLYDSNKCGTKLGEIVMGTSTSLTIEGNYAFVGVKSQDGAIYLDSISFTCVSGSGKTYNATPTEQAKAWAQYFINETRTADTCLASTDNEKLAGLKSKWSDLSLEYTAMVKDSKNEFCNNKDNLITQARNHYQFIISKFNAKSQELTPFVVDGDNKPLNNGNSNYNLSTMNDISSVIIIVTGLFSVVTLSTCILIKRKRSR